MSHSDARGPGHIRGLIAELGASAEAVAQRLAESGATGRRDDAGSCPVAHYLLDRTDATDVAVSRTEIWVQYPGGECYVHPPAAVADFVESFDAGRFPALAASSQPDRVADPGTDHGPEVCP
ncbi:hypothetical protein M1L60_19720 [Actinoplanes sp. TRM 88003]|uniref:Uncharacterized protein n=1 Tax=Paractinoplanes aksuensis TaxID=2939490 RepID=A0ABT1DPQ2_9ACTN|nr:hypothetical protein [Actinoplanes aksuensis]MCO8272828.1 hypothetical protein [Actinoplanes aksuensis]